MGQAASTKLGQSVPSHVGSTTDAFAAVSRPPGMLMATGDLVAIIGTTAVVGLLAPHLLPSPISYAPLSVLIWLAPGLLVLAWMATRGRIGRRAPGRVLLIGGLGGAVGTAAVGIMLLPDLHRAIGPALAWVLFPAPALGLRALLGQPAALLLLRDWRRGLADTLSRMRDRMFGFDSRWALAMPAGKLPLIGRNRRSEFVPEVQSATVMTRGAAGPDIGMHGAPMPHRMSVSDLPTPAFQPAASGQRRVALFFKAAVDIIAAGSALLFLAPLMLLLAVLVKLDGGPVLFAHGRIGRGGTRFPCLKFRSMVTDSDQVLRALLERDPAAAAEWAETQKLRQDPRITLVGRFMRKTSLDELPQLLNVLHRDMSLVGPRPIVAAEVPRYGEDIAYYLAIRPGITGLWQVSGRSNTSYAERVALDTAYVREWSFWKDVTIVARTIPAVLARKGAV
jgi:exopolysaccharide production protein ExoY